MKEIEIILRKFILYTYLFFKKDLKKQNKLEIRKSSKILLIRLNKIGDALVTTPLISKIKETYDCNIHVVADKKNQFIFANNKNIDRTFVFDKKGSKIKELRNTLNSEKYLAVFDLHDDVSTTVSLFLGSLQIKNKVGFDKSNKKLFTHVVPYLNPAHYHVVDRYLQILNYFDIPFQKNKIRIDYQPNNSSIEHADSYVGNNFPNKNFIVGINISAGSDARFWGVKPYKKLISFFSKYDLNILLFCSPNDEEKAKQIKNDNCNIFIDPDFDKFAAMISKLDFLFTPDTSVVHLCSAFNIPMFGIYIKYKTQNMIWYPYNTKHELIVTTKPTFTELGYESVITKLTNFFESIYNGKRNS